MAQLPSTLSSLLADHQCGHSDLQMDSFITIRSGGTIYGCYRQALRELWKRWRGLRDLYTQRELLAVELDKLAHSAESSPDEFQRRTDHINLISRRIAREEMAKVTADTEREFLRFYGQAVALREALDISDDKPLTAERRAVLDAEMWEHQLRCMLALDCMTQGRPSGKSLGLLQCLPVPTRKRIVAECLAEGKANTLIEWYLAFAPAIPEPLALPEAEARSLIACCESPLSQRPLPNSPPTAALLSA